MSGYLTGGRRFLSGERLVGVPAAVLLVAGGVACSRGSGESESGDDESTAMQDAALEFAKCMRGQGLDSWPDPVVGANGDVDLDSGEDYSMDMPEVQAASEVCSPIIQAVDDEANDRQSLTPEQEAEARDAALAMTECMRDRGWDLPDPTFDQDGGAANAAVEGDQIPEQGSPDWDRNPRCSPRTALSGALG